MNSTLLMEKSFEIDSPRIDFSWNSPFETANSYSELYNRFRPPALTIPGAHPNLVELLKKQMGNEIKSSTSEDSILSQAKPEEKDNSCNARLIFRLASLDVSDPLVIPEGRIRTPRTPRTPASCKRTVSPIDERRGNVKTPKDLLIQRYKGLTPRQSDFINIM